MLLPYNGFYVMGKLLFSKVKIVNLIRDLPGTESVLWPLGEGFTLSGSFTTSDVYTGWLIFIIEPCDGTVNKGCPWSPWVFNHNCSSCGMWRIAGLTWQFLSHQQMLFHKYNSEPHGHVLGQLIKCIARSPWLSVVKGFSQHFLCHCICALIGCEWSHYTVYFS